MGGQAKDTFEHYNRASTLYSNIQLRYKFRIQHEDDFEND